MKKIKELVRPLALIGDQSRTHTWIKLTTFFRCFLQILVFTCSASKVHRNVSRRLGTLRALMPKQISYKGGYTAPKRVTQEQK